eukprot:TRINITY_DN46425_c0_g1_i1.p1 TRINITY_DN46425_c0_g1~~TRINITY_DN46425_c0_g1_i1.p1  ORF type:complete len:563 (-),score=51.70 TRINITY_DN46425_c0_g1_i1:80-1768(-)
MAYSLRPLPPVAVLCYIGVILPRSSGVSHRPPKDRPNFVMFFVDDLGYGDTGFTGHPTTQTPNIDRLAFGGKILTTWYAGYPVCSASRASLMTGRQSQRTGVPGVLNPVQAIGLPLNETTLAEQLKKAEYATAIVGKWHLGQRNVYLPGNRGFDYYLGIPYSVDMGMAQRTECNRSCTTSGSSNLLGADEKVDGDEWMMQAYKAGGYLWQEESGERRPLLPLVYQEHGHTRVLEQPVDLTKLDEKYNSFVVDFIANHADSPFFLYLPFSHVHTTASNQPEKQYAGCAFKNKTLRGPFGDALLEADWIVGNVYKAIVEADIEENTLILFTGDNGPWLQQGLSSGSTGLFTGRYSGYWNTGKGSTWEGGIREPAFAYWKGQISSFTRSAEVVSGMDVFPTLSGLAGVALPVDRTYDGRDMKEVLLNDGGRSKHDFLFFYGGCMKWGTPAAVRHGKWKAHWCTGPGLSGCLGCKKQIYDTPLLFNVDKDPSEAEPVDPEGVEAKAALARIETALRDEMAKFSATRAVPEPDGPDEGPGKYGVCCDRKRRCDCNGSPSTLSQLEFV